jgi:hypothetical protein
MFDVALLIERELNDLDADQVVALHEGLDDTVTYHLLLPVEISPAALTSSMSALGGGQVLPPPTDPDVDVDVEKEIVRAGEKELAASADLLRARGQQVTAELTEDDPIDALVALVKRTGASEAIILTESHVVKEFLHVDWLSRARRHLDIPSIQLVEHVPFDAQI